MSHNIEHNIKQPSTWKRGAYILLFSIFYQMAAALLILIITFQFVNKLVTGDTNKQFRQLSRSIASYIYQVFQFMSFNSNDIPYPFSDWPEGELDIVENSVSKKAAGKKTEIDDVLKKSDPASDADRD